MNNLKYSLHYASQGYHILPTHYNKDGQCSCGQGLACRSPFKHPTTRNGVLDATTDSEIIKRWWERDNWNVAFRTGPESGIFVVDIDNLDHRDRIEFPETLTAKTPRGIHLYYIWEEGISNRAKIYGLEIDIRGKQGYVLAPPSNGYSWLNDNPIVKAPSWFVRSIKKG